MPNPEPPPPGGDELAPAGNQSVLGEMWALLRHNKKWWLIPLLIALLAFGVLVFLSGTAAAPFVYTLF